MDIKILCIDEGHTLSPGDYGAVGNGIKESEETRVLGKLVEKYLKQLNVQVNKCTVDYADSIPDSINKRLQLVNAKANDLLVIIHFNSFSNEAANGTEVLMLPYKNNYYQSKNGYNINYQIAERLCNAVATTGGFSNRGIKFREDLGMLIYPTCYAVYLEVCFISNKLDATKYKAKKEEIAKSIAESIINKNIEKVEYDMNKIVVYAGDADLFAAVMVAQKNQCPLMKLSDYKASGLKAQTVIQIGGKAEDTNRYVTFKNAAALV